MNYRNTLSAAVLGFAFLSPGWAQLAPPASATAPAPAAAAPVTAERPINVVLTQKKVIKDERGRDKLVEAESVLPNDVIEYRAVYKNVGAQPVKQIAARVPLPEGLEYVPGTAEPKKGAQFAPSSGVYGAEPLKQKLPDGRTVNLPYNEYRQVRWVIDELAPGAETTVAVRAKLESGTPVVSSAAVAPAASAAPATKP